MRLLRRLGSNVRGATMVEYGLILALIFIAMAVGLQFMSHQVVGTWNSISNKVANVT